MGSLLNETERERSRLEGSGGDEEPGLGIGGDKRYWLTMTDKDPKGGCELGHRRDGSLLFLWLLTCMHVGIRVSGIKRHRGYWRLWTSCYWGLLLLWGREIDGEDQLASVEQAYPTLGVRTRSSNDNCRRRGRCDMQQVRARENDTPMQDRNKSRCREMLVE